MTALAADLKCLLCCYKLELAQSDLQVWADKFHNMLKQRLFSFDISYSTSILLCSH